MINIIVAFPKLEDAQNIKNVLIRNAYEVRAICTTGSQVVNLINNLDDGIVICGYRFSDMHYIQLHEYLPKGFEMLLIASATKRNELVGDNIVCLELPIKTNDFINTIQMMTRNCAVRRKQNKYKPKKRTEEEKKIIEKAKIVLMERNYMSEEDAHRYIQKTSMDSGTNMVETAEMIINMFL